MNKTRVTVTTPDAAVHALEGDSVILFTVSDIEEFLKGSAKKINAESVYIGKEIPRVIFAETVGALVADFIGSENKSYPTLAAFDLLCVCKILKAREQQLIKESKTEQVYADFEKALDDLFIEFLRK